MTGGAQPPGDVDAATARRLLEVMWRIRAFEERLGLLERASPAHGPVHLSIGHEAVAAGVCTQLRDDEPVYTGHRAHGHALAKGVDTARLMAELMGRADGLCKGLGGSMHLVDTSRGFLGATGVVGGNLPFAIGSALAGRQLGRPVPVVAVFGDGAAQAGIFSESVNLASLWALPVLFVCDNDGFADRTPSAARTRVARVGDLVAPYGIPALTVDGGDVVEVWRAFGGALAAARDGDGPFLLECLTHRRSGPDSPGHGACARDVRDVGGPRPALGDEEWQASDPIQRLVRHARAAGWFDEEASGPAEAAARQEVEAAVAFGAASRPPDPSLAAELTYARLVADGEVAARPAPG